MNHRIITVPPSHALIRMHQLPEPSFSFHFELAEVKFKREGADLLIQFANQGKTVISGFFPSDAKAELPLIVLSSGQVVPGEFLCMANPGLSFEKSGRDCIYALDEGDALAGMALGGCAMGRPNAL